MPSQQVLTQKAQQVEEIKKLLSQYKVVGIASLEKVRAAQLQELKKKLEKQVYMRVFKNTLVKRAIEELNDSRLKKLEEYLTGANIFLFTNMNPFKLSILLEKNKVKAIAKAGDKAVNDIIVPAGNTGLPPGPVISQFSSVGIPTRIESGSVWINKDTLVCKKGEVISLQLANILSKLGIKAVEIGLTLKVVYDDGQIITEEDLMIDLEEIRKSIEEAQSYAFNLSINAAIPMPENISLLLQKAQQEAYTLAVNAAVPTKETIEDLLRKAYAEALSLSQQIKFD
ncbi:50S ribosomal protein L10 [Candidatus Bathyarchaeota archaeon]|nr:50S ribosomal protein L10 [Candidatus Bathyarchaeota archaeon]